MASDNAGCGHPLGERFWAGDVSFLCLRCLDTRLQDLRNLELLDKDLRNLNTCLIQGNNALIERLSAHRPNGSPTGVRLIKRILALCASSKPLSATGYRSIAFILLAFGSRSIPRKVFRDLLPSLSKFPKECRKCVIHLMSQTDYSVEDLAPHAKTILKNTDSGMTRSVIELLHQLVVKDTSLMKIYIRKLLHLVKREHHSVGTQSILRGLLFAAKTTPGIFVDRQNPGILEALNPFMSKRQSQIVCGILYIIVINDHALDLIVANDVPLGLAELALTCVNVDCAKIFLNCLGDLFRVKNGRAFTPNSALKIFSVLLVLQEVTFDADVALSLLHLLTSLIDCKQFRGMRKAEGDLLLAQLDALCQKDVPEIGTAALKCFGCSLVTDKLPPDVSFDRCLNMFAKCIRAFGKEKITLEHFVDCATEFSKWSVRVKNESQQRTPLLPVEFVPAWIDNLVLELLERLLSHSASKLTRRRVLVLLKNSLELVGSDRSPKHWEACLKLSWALVEREMDSAEARAFIAAFISTLSPTTEPSFENARYLQTSAPVDLESTQDEIVACLILYNTMAHFLPHRNPPPMERLRELIASIIRCGFRWRRQNLVGAIRLLVALLPSEAGGNPIRGSLRKLILFLPPDILRECLSSLANSEATRRLIFEDEDRSFEELANQVIEKLSTSKRMGALIAAAETGSKRIAERIVRAVFSLGVLEQFMEETKSRGNLPENLIECLFGIVAAYRDRDPSQVLKAMEILDFVMRDTERFNHKHLAMAKALMEIYSVEQLSEIPHRFLRIVKSGFDIRSYLISDSEQILLHSFLTAVTHKDWLVGLELFLELEEKIPQFPLTFSWDQMEAYLRTRGERCDLVLRAIALSFKGNRCLMIEPSVDLKFTRDFCSDCLEDTVFDHAALEVLLLMEYPEKWSLASYVALARTEASSKHSKRVTAQLLNQCLEFYRIEWILLVSKWFTKNSQEIGEVLWSDFVAKVENLTEMKLESPFGVDSRSRRMSPAQQNGDLSSESAPC